MVKSIAEVLVLNACCVGEIGLHALDVDTKTWEHFEGRGRGKGRPHRTHAALGTPAPLVKSSRRSEELLGGEGACLMMGIWFTTGTTVVCSQRCTTSNKSQLLCV